MALSIGTGPFGEHPTGRFDVEPPHRPLLFWEPFPKRFRVVVAGETIADSREVVALHETGQFMRLCVPSSDVTRELLVPGLTATTTLLGITRFWTVVTSTEPLHEAAQSLDTPPTAASLLKDYFIFDLGKVDAWYLEEDLGYAHPRDPYHRCDVHRSSASVIVRAGATTIAETNTAAILFETSIPPRFYLPPDAVRSEFLVKSETVSQCPYKGDGQHWHVISNGRRIADAAWSLTTPMGDALMIPRWFSFYPKKLEVQVDRCVLDD